MWSSDSQSLVPWRAASVSLWSLQILGPLPQTPTESWTLGMWPITVCFKKTWWFWCMLKFENHSYNWPKNLTGHTHTITYNHTWKITPPIANVKKQHQPSKFEDLTGFIQQFMNQAPSYLASRELFWGVVQNRRFV